MATKKTKDPKTKKPLIQSILTTEEKRPTLMMEPGTVVVKMPKPQRARLSSESGASALSPQGAAEDGAGARRKTTRMTAETTRMREPASTRQLKQTVLEEHRKRKDAPQTILQAGELETSSESEGKELEVQQSEEEDGSEEYDPYQSDLLKDIGFIKINQQQILQAITKLEQHMQTEFKEIKRNMKKMETAMGKMDIRVQKVEDDGINNHEEIVDCRERVDKMDDSFTGWQLQRDQLLQKIDQMENQSRRNNIKILGLPENLEPQEPTQFFQNWLMQTFNFDQPVELERAHRIGRRNQIDRRPRPVLMKCLRYQDREKILRLAIQKSRENNAPMMIEGNRVLFYPDLSSEVVRRRKEFNAAKAILWQKGYKFSFRYPAALRIQDNGDKFLLFMDPHQAYLHAQNLPRLDTSFMHTLRQQDEEIQVGQVVAPSASLREEIIRVQAEEGQEELALGAIN